MRFIEIVANLCFAPDTNIEKSKCSKASVIQGRTQKGFQTNQYKLVSLAYIGKILM